MMNKEPYSIFNDVLGPVLVGPSSSHTAGPSKIGHMTKCLIESEPAEVVFEFEKNGSFATSYDMQGTDRGLVGGVLGYKADDERLLSALEKADEAGLKYDFRITEFEANHPNTVRINITGKDGEKATATGESIGGGIIQLTEVNGFNVHIDGKHIELLLFSDGMFSDNEINEIVETLPDGYEEVLHHKKISKEMLEIKLCYLPDSAAVNILKNRYTVRVIPAVFPILSQNGCTVPFRSSEELELWAEGLFTPGEAGLIYETTRSGLDSSIVLDKMIELIDIMEESVNDGLSSRRPGRLIKARSGDYLKAKEENRLVDCGAMDTAIAWSMAMVERNSYYARVVAAPTSGACGTVPGAVLGVANYMNATKEEKVMAMFAAGAIGIIIAEKATFAAELCGCQAECGSASAMAAAGIVQLLGGTVSQSLEAASIALQNVLGMICDSVANLVEVPCLGRNVLGAVNAISAANMVMAGEEAVIPFDEVCTSMMEVGKLMPRELCCTNSGGLAVTKTSLRLAEKIQCDRKCNNK